MINESMFSSGKDDWETPDDFFIRYNNKYAFVLDAAADGNNTKCASWFGVGGVYPDALNADWVRYLRDGNIWLNPPYSRKLQRAFLEKVIGEMEIYNKTYSEENHVVCLLPARTDTKNFHDLIKPNAVEIEFIKGRLKFKGAKHGAPFPSMIVVF